MVGCRRAGVIFRSDGKSAVEGDGAISSSDDVVVVGVGGRTEKTLVMGKGLLAKSSSDGDELDTSDATSRRKARKSASAASSRVGGGRGWASAGLGEGGGRRRRVSEGDSADGGGGA